MASVFNFKITEVENKIPDIKNLASKTEVTAVNLFFNHTNVNSVSNEKYPGKPTGVKNKISNVSNLVTETDYATEITKIKNDYATNAALDARHRNLVQKTTFESEF